jgi:hypothetical protein
MLVRTLDFLRDSGQTSVVRGLPAFVARLAGHAAQLNALGEAQGRVTQGARLHRDRRLGELRDSALELAAVVAVYALEHRRLHLLPLVNVTPTSFNVARLDHKLWLASRIADAAASVLPEIEPFGVTAEMIAELREKIRDAHEVLDAPRFAILQRQSTTRQIASTLQAAAVTLAQIDRLLFPLRRSAPQFHADYRAARRVLGRRSGRSDDPANVATNDGAVTASAAEPNAALPRKRRARRLTVVSPPSSATTPPGATGNAAQPARAELEFSSAAFGGDTAEATSRGDSAAALVAA